jgi:type VI secretion system secreted protein VgrG
VTGSNLSQHKRLISITTPLGENVLYISTFQGEERISGLFNYQLDLFSTRLDLTAQDLLGKQVTWQIQQDAQPIRYFNGFITQCNAGAVIQHNYRSYTVTISPWLWFLTQTQNSQIFQNKSIPEIIKQVFDNYGFSAYQSSGLKRSYEKLEYCVQYNESAYHFIARLMEQEGIFYYFKHEQDKHSLILADDNSTFKTSSMAEVTYAQTSYPTAHLSQWSHTYSFCLGKVSHTDYNFTAPASDLLTSSNTLHTLPYNSKLEQYQFPGNYQNIEQGRASAKRRMEMHEAGFSKIQAVGNCAGLATGEKFKLANHDRAAEQGKYIIVSMQHAAVDNSYFNTVDEGSRYTNQLICIPEGTPFRPSTQTAKPVIQGPQTALVVGPDGEEVYTDQYGRIKVKFRWDRTDAKDENSSCWIRVAQIWTGKNWGAVFNPRIGQEVIVDFLNGDPDRPIVIGCVYNAEQLPPYPLATHAEQFKSGIKTHSEKGTAETFNELRFEDNKDKELVYLRAQKDFTREVKHDDSLVVEHDQTITIKNNRSETISEGNDALTIKKGQRTVTVETGNDIHQIKQGNREVQINMGNDTLTIDQGDHITKVSLGKSSIEAMQSIELKVGTNSIKIDQTGITLTGMLIKLKGQTLIQVEADAMLTLKGGITMIN